MNIFDELEKYGKIYSRDEQHGDYVVYFKNYKMDAVKKIMKRYEVDFDYNARDGDGYRSINFHNFKQKQTK